MIIWRELLCRDASKACRFYSRVFGWSYVAEEADDYAWGDGPGVYRLIRSASGIHAGIAEISAGEVPGWVSYALVNDVDVTLEGLDDGSVILRNPFDVPGVGRNALLETPGGVRFGITTPAYDDAREAPDFATDLLLTRSPSEARGFLRYLGISETGPGRADPLIVEAAVDPDIWVPCFAVDDPSKTRDAAFSFGASPFNGPGPTGRVLLTDSAGHLFGLSQPREPSR